MKSTLEITKSVCFNRQSSVCNPRSLKEKYYYFFSHPSIIALLPTITTTTLNQKITSPHPKKLPNVTSLFLS